MPGVFQSQARNCLISPKARRSQPTGVNWEESGVKSMQIFNILARQESLSRRQSSGPSRCLAPTFWRLHFIDLSFLPLAVNLRSFAGLRGRNFALRTDAAQVYCLPSLIEVTESAVRE